MTFWLVLKTPYISIRAVCYTFPFTVAIDGGPFFFFFFCAGVLECRDIIDLTVVDTCQRDNGQQNLAIGEIFSALLTKSLWRMIKWHNRLPPVCTATLAALSSTEPGRSLSTISPFSFFKMWPSLFSFHMRQPPGSQRGSPGASRHQILHIEHCRFSDGCFLYDNFFTASDYHS